MARGVHESLSQNVSFSKKTFTQRTRKKGERRSGRQTVEEAERKTKAAFQSYSSTDIIKVRHKLGNSHVSATSFQL